jgi:hypothetical protein
MQNSKLGCKSYELFHFSCSKFNFHVILRSFGSHVDKIAQGLKGRVPKEMFF